MEEGQRLAYGMRPMQRVRITVVDVRGSDEKPVETRFVDVETDRRLNGAVVRHILQREFPEAGSFSVLLKTDAGWKARYALEPVGGCDYHYVWRHYRVTPG